MVQPFFTRRSLLTGASALIANMNISNAATLSKETPRAIMLPNKPWLIDTHQHFLPEAYVKAIRTAQRGQEAGFPFPQWDLQSTLDFMDQALIKKAYLSISDPGVNFGDNGKARQLSRLVNEEAAKLSSLHPTRFGSFASLPTPDVDGALLEISYALDELRLDGVVMLSSYIDGSYLGDARFDPIMNELNRRKAVVFVHPTMPQISKGLQTSVPGFVGEFVFDTTRAILNLVWTGVAHRFPDIRFIFAHAGGTLPYIAWRASKLDSFTARKEEYYPQGMLEYLKGFFYDVALSSAPTSLTSILELVAPSQLLFGSDYCFAKLNDVKNVKEMLIKSDRLETSDILTIGRNNAANILTLKNKKNKK